MKMAGIDVHKKVLMVVVVDASTPEEKPARRRFVTMFGRSCMKGCDLSSKAAKSLPEKRRNVPRCWREHFANSATRSPSHP